MKTRNKTLRRSCICALFAALLCVLSPVAIPIGTIPISLSFLVVLFCASMLGAGGAVISVLIYLVLGALGLPVFAGGMGGVGVLVGPTGGYIWSYLPISAVCGFLYHRVWINHRSGSVLRGVAVGALGMLICYLFGTVQYAVVANVSIWAAILVCVFPFLLFDLFKIVAVALLSEHLLRIASMRAVMLELFSKKR